MTYRSNWAIVSDEDGWATCGKGMTPKNATPGPADGRRAANAWGRVLGTGDSGVRTGEVFDEGPERARRGGLGSTLLDPRASPGPVAAVRRGEMVRGVAHPVSRQSSRHNGSLDPLTSQHKSGPQARAEW